MEIAADAGGTEGTPAREPRALLVPALVVVLTAGTLALGAMVPRDLSLGEDAPIWNARGDLLAFELSRAVTVLVLLGCAGFSAAVVVRKGFPRTGLSLWLSYVGFVVTNHVLPAVAGREPGFDVRLLYAPAVFTAAYLARPVASDRLASLVKGALLAFVWASLAAAVVSPAQALAAGFRGLVPGIDFRLYGIGGGATSLGTISAAYLTVELVSPSRGRLRWVNVTAAAAALVLTQSKTSWLFVLLVGAFRARRALPALDLGRGASARAARWMILGVGLAAGAALAAAALARLDLAPLPGGENLATLTGRTYIWATSLRTFLESPVFGYGVGLWESERFVAEHGAWDHAHNQFLHSLASGGVIGLAGLLAYLGAAFAAGRRAAAATEVPLVLLAGVVFLCLTNVPLRHQYVLDAFTLLHFLVFVSALHAVRARRPESE